MTREPRGVVTPMQEGLRDALARAERQVMRLRAVNEQLVLTALHSLPDTPALPDLNRDTNEQLLLAILTSRDMQDVAEQARQRQDDFVATLAHELQHPLAPLRSLSSLLARAHRDDPILPQIQAIVDRQTTHLALLISDLLDVTRARTGKLRILMVPLDLNDPLTEAVDAYRPAIDRRDQLLTVIRPVVSRRVAGDRFRLMQIFSNLLDNASKFTPRLGTVTVTLAYTETHAVVSLRDSGMGISAEALPTIFVPFAQDTYATGFDSDGMGLGLAVARDLVLAHGGSVEAKSDGGGAGATFIVAFPLLEERVGIPVTDSATDSGA